MAELRDRERVLCRRRGAQEAGLCRGFRPAPCAGLRLGRRLQHRPLRRGAAGERGGIGDRLRHRSRRAGDAAARAADGKLDFLPLFADAANPSPAQGWAEAERSGLSRAATPTRSSRSRWCIISRSAATSAALRRGLAGRPRAARRDRIRAEAGSDDPAHAAAAARHLRGLRRQSIRAGAGSPRRIVRRLELAPGGRTLYEFERAPS